MVNHLLCSGASTWGPGAQELPFFPRTNQMAYCALLCRQTLGLCCTAVFSRHVYTPVSFLCCTAVFFLCICMSGRGCPLTSLLSRPPMGFHDRHIFTQVVTMPCWRRTECVLCNSPGRGHRNLELGLLSTSPNAPFPFADVALCLL